MRISGRCLILAVIFGSAYVYPPSGVDYSSYKKRLSFCFFSLFFNCVVQMQTIPLYFEDRVTFQRERGAKLYLPVSYWLTTWIANFCFQIVHTLVYASVAYFFAGFQDVAWRWFFFFAVVLFCANTAYYICQLIAAFSPNPQTAMGIFPIAVFTNFLFSGYFQFIPNMQFWLQGWAPNCSFYRWALQALVLNEYDTNPALPIASTYVSELGFSGVNANASLGILILFLVFYLGLVCIAVLR